MKWFQRHLNWTLLAVLLIGQMLYMLTSEITWYLPARIIILILTPIVVGWYLTNKNRSLGWLILPWLLAGLAYAGSRNIGNIGIEHVFSAGLVLLLLKNKTIKPKEPKDPLSQA